jgi:hypothetical protein
MDYIRISHRVTESPSPQGLVAEPVEVLTAHSSQFTAKDVKELLKDWIKLYPNSFAPDVDFKIYQLADGDIIIQLHEDLSSMAVSLLVLYFENISRQDNKTTRQQGLLEVPIVNSQRPTAYITIDDTEVLLKQNEGKRAMVFCSHRDTETPRHQGLVTEPVEVPIANSQVPTANSQQLTAVRFLLEDNYVLDYNFEKRAQPVKGCDLVFEEPEFSLPEEYESVRVGDVVKKKIDEILEEGLTPQKMLIYFLCGAIGLSIGFLIVYFMGR